MTRTDLAFDDLIGVRCQPRMETTRPRHARRRPGRAAWPLRRVAVVLVFGVSAGAAIYPTGAAWVTDQVHAGELSGYMQSVAAIPTADRTAMLAEARAYNDSLAGARIADPYSLGPEGLPDGTTAAAVEQYLRTLAVGAGGVMGRLRIERIDVSLPIFHGTGERSLSQGVGHLFGTSLPVGGPGTHAVLTSHSGLLNATLFTHLEELEIGDRFEIAVLGETFVYQVDRIRTVLPDATDDLVATPHDDFVTLVTCTPTGVNTHRLLVRGHRVEGAATVSERTALLAAGNDWTFPWWALGYVVAVGAAIGLSRFMAAPPRRKQPDPEPGPRRKGL